MVRRSRAETVEHVTEELLFPSGGFVACPGADEDEFDRRVVPAARRFVFELCRKTSSFGGVPIDHFWFGYPSIYAQRNSAARNYEPTVDCFWALCMLDRTAFDEGAQESYILAKLFPYARANGSRRVFEDAVLTRSIRLGQGKYDLIQNLDELLASARTQETDMAIFRDQTATLLGPGEYTDEVWDRYRQREEELLVDGRQALEQSGPVGLEAALNQWRRWMNTIGRRRGNELDKQILDIFSYECRAALHRAYSAVWCELLPRLANKYALSAESVAFHRLWHLEQSMPSGDPRSFFHLFHGHVFGLHPGLSIFIQTRTGTELIGAALQESPLGGPAFRRALNGMLIALGDYAGRSEQVVQSRNWESRCSREIDVEIAHAAEISQSIRRRGGAPRDG